jgi:hypothetical protein
MSKFVIPALWLMISCLLGQSWLEGLRTPLFWTVTWTGGYDSNVLRLSPVEQAEAAANPELLGQMQTFDSPYLRGSLGLNATFRLKDRRKRVVFNLSGNGTAYTHTPEKRYWSGQLQLAYRWGSYRGVSYTLRRLNDYYLRPYTNRDVSTRELAACRFTDQEQVVSLSRPLSPRWRAKLSAGYLQRYYNPVFSEFDVDIYTGGLQLYYKPGQFGRAALAVAYGRARNITYQTTARASGLDRSYRYLEISVPLRVAVHRFGIREAGFTWETELRRYEAEDISDPLHSGRSHRDTKWTGWVRKEVGKAFTLTAKIRYRDRRTASSYEWVETLKSYRQVTAWVSIAYDFVYDRY